MQKQTTTRLRPFFSVDNRRIALNAEAERWMGTPFFAHAAVLGVGVDCVHLVHEILVAIPAITRLTLPDYKLDHAKHSTDTQLLRFLLDAEGLRGRLAMVPPIPEKLMVGDLVALQSGRVDHHLALVDLEREAIHAVEDYGVIRTQLTDEKFAPRILYAMRLMETVTT
jgi:hypothetical protein